MCLQSITTKFDKPSSVILSGWKHFSGTKQSPMFQHFGLDKDMTVPLDRWLRAQGSFIDDNRSGYEVGFHIYENEKEFKDDKTLRRVYYRNVHTRGTDSNVTTIVAREMYVPSDPEAWPPRV